MQVILFQREKKLFLLIHHAMTYIHPLKYIQKWRKHIYLLNFISPESERKMLLKHEALKKDDAGE